ncbi:hypothetical protein F4604DRAFT_1536923, partial [Suillus subluteus]
VVKDVLDVPKDLTIASKAGEDPHSSFWTVYKKIAEEKDQDFLEQHTSNMDIVLVFV